MWYNIPHFPTGGVAQPTKSSEHPFALLRGQPQLLWSGPSSLEQPPPGGLSMRWPATLRSPGIEMLSTRVRASWLLARPANQLRWGVKQASRTRVRGQTLVCPYSLPCNWLRRSSTYLCNFELNPERVCRCTHPAPYLKRGVQADAQHRANRPKPTMEALTTVRASHAPKGGEHQGVNHA